MDWRMKMAGRMDALQNGKSPGEDVCAEDVGKLVLDGEGIPFPVHVLDEELGLELTEGYLVHIDILGPDVGQVVKVVTNAIDGGLPEKAAGRTKATIL